YIFFTGLMAAPVVQIASIGTQISEAFAGLDRIHELMSMRTEDDEDSTREPVADVNGATAFEHVSFAYNAGGKVLDDVSFAAPAGEPRRPRGRVHRRVREEVRHDRRRARREDVRRPAAARRDRPGDAGRSPHPRARRSDLRTGQRERGADPGRAQVAARRADD